MAFDSYMGTTNYPLAVAATRDGRRVYVASQRDACVYAVDATDPKAMRVVGRIQTGAHPAALLLDEPNGRLFVSNADGDTVSEVSVASDRVTATVLLRPQIAKGVPGVSPLGLGLTPDGRTLYVALADLNALGVIDTRTHTLAGYVPAGWYPSAVTTNGRRLLVADAKGTTTRYPNPPEQVAATRPTTGPAMGFATTRPGPRQFSPLNWSRATS